MEKYSNCNSIQIKKKNNKKAKWASLMVAGLMVLNSCSSTGNTSLNENEINRGKISLRNYTQEIKHTYDLCEISKMKDKDRFETGIISIFYINFGKEGKPIKREDDKNDMYRDYFSITKLDDIRNPLNPINLKKTDPLLYKILSEQVMIHNINKPDNPITINNLILNYIRFFGFDILDKIKNGEVKFEKVGGNI
jgi:hypothetical protein